MSRSIVIVRVVLAIPLIVNYPCIIGFHRDNSNVSTCPEHSSSRAKGLLPRLGYSAGPGWADIFIHPEKEYFSASTDAWVTDSIS